MLTTQLLYSQSLVKPLIIKQTKKKKKRPASKFPSHFFSRKCMRERERVESFERMEEKVPHQYTPIDEQQHTKIYEKYNVIMNSGKQQDIKN